MPLKHFTPFRLLSVLLTSALLLASVSGAGAAAAVHHDLKVTLHPETHTLSGLDTIRVRSPRPALSFSLSESAVVKKVTVGGTPHPFNFSGGLLSIRLGSKKQESTDIGIAYEAFFNDPYPRRPANTENPGYGVTGIISAAGCFLLGGAGWYPHARQAGAAAFSVTVTAPAGMTAVTAGRSLEVVTRDGKTISRWEIHHPAPSLSLSAGPYEIKKRKVGDVTAATFFFPETGHLSSGYLDAVEKYLLFYISLFGDYPFPKFAVVENFFPTGYGFPSYTLLGSTVIRLPFIINTSLGHEIAHCWWGNGVYPDMSRGNWSEGLTTYVADYLFNEQASRQAARQYRRQIMREYSTVVAPGAGFPLAAFTGRSDPLTKSIGYGKSAMVFHMLRRRVGDDIFWKGLGRIYERRLFRKTGWSGFQTVFETLSGQSLDTFFRQWVSRAGAPIPALEDVKWEKEEKNSTGAGTVAGRIVQTPPFYDLQVEMAVKTESGETRETVHLAGVSTRFEIGVTGTPETLSFDPDFHSFRRLYPSEIPPSVNSLKGSGYPVVVLAQDSGADLQDTARLLMNALGIETWDMVSESSLDKKDLPGRDVFWVGPPGGHTGLFSKMPRNLKFEKNRFILKGVSYAKDSHPFFGVFPHPFSPKYQLVLFWPSSTGYAMDVARKVPHYGKYGYLVFSGAGNRDKGQWPVKNSPLVYRFNPGKGEGRK